MHLRDTQESSKIITVECGQKVVKVDQVQGTSEDGSSQNKVSTHSKR